MNYQSMPAGYPTPQGYGPPKNSSTAVKALLLVSVVLAVVLVGMLVQILRGGQPASSEQPTPPSESKASGGGASPSERESKAPSGGASPSERKSKVPGGGASSSGSESPRRQVSADRLMNVNGLTEFELAPGWVLDKREDGEVYLSHPVTKATVKMFMAESKNPDAHPASICGQFNREEIAAHGDLITKEIVAMPGFNFKGDLDVTCGYTRQIGPDDAAQGAKSIDGVVSVFRPESKPLFLVQVAEFPVGGPDSAAEESKAGKEAKAMFLEGATYLDKNS